MWLDRGGEGDVVRAPPDPCVPFAVVVGGWGGGDVGDVRLGLDGVVDGT